MWLISSTESPLPQRCLPVLITQSVHPIKIKSNQITFIVTSPQHKCLGEWNSYERAPESKKKKKKKKKTLHMDRQCKKPTNNLHMDRQCKKTTNNLHMDRQCKKTTNNLHMDRQCKKKTALEHLQCSRQCKKTTNNLHMDSTYLQTVQKTMCKIHIHILSTHSVL